jgi:hypothetical protein
MSWSTTGPPRKDEAPSAEERQGQSKGEASAAIIPLPRRRCTCCGGPLLPRHTTHALCRQCWLWGRIEVRTRALAETIAEVRELS